MIQSVYLDNGATSFPKASGVVEAVTRYISEIGANVNRSSHSMARNASMTVFETRELVKKFFHYQGEESHVIFTSGATFSLNQAITRYLKPEHHVLVSSLEHNAVMRPLRELERKGLKISLIPTDSNGIADIRETIDIIENNQFDMVIISHASNVCGNIFPVEKISDLLKTKGIPLVLDASQSAGHIEVNFDKLQLSALCAPAHKGLLAPQGLGLLILEEGFAKNLEPIIRGGTGSLSNSDSQPAFLPDKFESGTMNIPAIYGLNASLKYIMEKGIETIRERELYLSEYFINKLKDLEKNTPSSFKMLGGEELKDRVGVISLDFQDFDNAEISDILESDYGIMTRCGLHCAPIAHKTLMSYPQGSVRFSLSHFTTEEEIDYTINALREVLHG